MNQTAPTRGEGIRPQDLFHKRVDGSFLPISIRQNRVEDVFAHFLRALAPLPDESSDGAPNAKSKAREDAETKARQIVDAMAQRTDLFRLPTRPEDRTLVLDWVRQELLVESRATNRLSIDPASLIPMHLAVGQRFIPRTNPPDYGGMLCELLADEASGKVDLSLLESLKGFMGSSEGDIVARVLEGTLWIPSDRSPRYAATRLGKLVACRTHARKFREAVRRLLAYRQVIARRTFVNWLFSLIDFYLATYFLRMAITAEYFGARIETILSGEEPGEPLTDWDDARFQPKMAYGRHNPEHARVLKRYPYYTSMLLISRGLASAFLDSEPQTRDWNAFERAASKLSQHPEFEAMIESLVASYPTEESTEGRGWKLTPEERDAILKDRAEGTSAFLALSLLLNFEDMARRSNNIMEWQFYATLARDRSFGFARPARGDMLVYELSNEALGAFAHSFCVGTDRATFAGFVEYLERQGFLFDGAGRRRLEDQLVEHGLIDELADAGEAKFLTPMYRAVEVPSA